jgi:hypothetical protein
MNELSQSDLSRIRDEDLTPEQRKEIERRFHAFARALTRVKSAPPAAPKKAVTKWAPKPHRFGR